MAELRLPEGPAELFEAVRETIGKYLGGEHHMRLGGGTALAARWAHRHSTDVDLFTSTKPYIHLHARREAFVDEIERRAGPLDMIRVRPLNAKILLPGGGEVTLFTSPVLTGLARSGDTVRGTNVPIRQGQRLRRMTQTLSANRRPPGNPSASPVSAHCRLPLSAVQGIMNKTLQLPLPRAWGSSLALQPFPRSGLSPGWK